MPGGEQPPSENDQDPLVGARLDKYEVRKLLGVGGMGRVYEAWNTSIAKRVAIKVLGAEAAADAERAERFAREARVAGAIESPYIVSIFDAGKTADGRAYIVMELLRGASLASVLASRGPLPANEVTRIATQVLRGLERAHAASVIHRDLKPENVFLVDHDPEPPVAKILDFGISKLVGPSDSTALTKTNIIMGTPAYMSPEQVDDNDALDARTDVWSFGAMLYECLTGRPPFIGTSAGQILVRICTTEPVAVETLAPNCPSGLAAIVMRCLTKDRDARFQSATEVLAALGQAPTSAVKEAQPARARETTTAVGSAVTERAAPPAIKRRRAIWIGVGAIAAIGVAAIVTGVWLQNAPIKNQTPATTAEPTGAASVSASESAIETAQSVVVATQSATLTVSVVAPAESVATTTTSVETRMPSATALRSTTIATPNLVAPASASVVNSTGRAVVAVRQIVTHCWVNNRPRGSPAGTMLVQFDLGANGKASNVRFQGPNETNLRRCLVNRFDETHFGAGPPESVTVSVPLAASPQ